MSPVADNLPTLLVVEDEKNTREGLRRYFDGKFDIYLAPDVPIREQELERDALTRFDPHLGLLAAGMCGIKDDAVDGPLIACHIALQAQIETLVNRLRSERRHGDQPALQFQPNADKRSSVSA